MNSLPTMLVVDKPKKGRPRGTKPGSVSKKTGKRVKSPIKVGTHCSRDSVEWVATKRGKRCRCTTPGNKRFLKNSLCEGR